MQTEERFMARLGLKGLNEDYYDYYNYYYHFVKDAQSLLWPNK